MKKNALITALTAVDNTDIMLANNAAGVLYVEGRTDIELLREWARVLNHPLLAFLEKPFWKPTVQDSQGGGIQSEKHFEALRLVRSDIAVWNYATETAIIAIRKLMFCKTAWRGFIGNAMKLKVILCTLTALPLLSKN